MNIRALFVRPRQMAAGVALAGCLAGAALAIAALPWVRHFGLSALTLSILLGAVAGNSFFPAIAAATAPGVDFSKNTLLRAGVILYGFQITFGQIAAVGWSGVIVDALIILLTFTCAIQLGTRVFGLDRQTAALIGAGSAICGAAAVMATEPVLRAQPHRVSIAVATVVVFGTLSMFLYPLMYPHLGLSPQAYGIFAGSTIHEVAQVVAAGKAVSDTAATTAVIEKMLRVMMLAPFLFLLSRVDRREPRQREGGSQVRDARALSIPWFAVLFVATAGINSLGVLPMAAVKGLVQLDTCLLAAAMAALGLRTQAGAIARAGVRPLLLAGSLFLFLTIGGYWINRLPGLLERDRTARAPASSRETNQDGPGAVWLVR